VSVKAGISEPRQLIGKAIGTSEYQQTAGVWQRGMLQHDHGVAADAVEWRFGNYDQPGRFEDRVPMTLPDRIRTSVIPADQSLEMQLERGDIAAMLGSHAPAGFGRGSIARLFPDYQHDEVEYFRRTGLFPIMHMVVIKRSVYDAAPWVAASLFKAFVQAKRHGLRRLRETGPSLCSLPWLQQHLEQADEILGPDPYRYGLRPARKEIEAFLQYSREQGLIAHPLPIEELFAPETLDSDDDAIPD
jgi:4,5-dihydroxyphthalate decarboxylase